MCDVACDVCWWYGRSVCAIFKQLEGSGADFNLRVSFLELYNEELQASARWLREREARRAGRS